jgi:pimeloyl-ACP methyl ester carboxylesterase
MIVHEPPLFGLLRDDPEAQGALATVRTRIAAVVSTLTAGDDAAGARQFVETVAFGPGAWSELPQETRETFVNNAPTWLDEMHDPEALDVNLRRLREFRAPTLLTVGDQSPPFFSMVVDRVRGALPQADTHVYHGAGHAPHLSHPDQYVRVVTDFIGRGLASAR